MNKILKLNEHKNYKFVNNNVTDDMIDSLVDEIKDYADYLEDHYLNGDGFDQYVEHVLIDIDENFTRDDIIEKIEDDDIRQYLYNNKNIIVEDYFAHSCETIYCISDEVHSWHFGEIEEQLPDNIINKLKELNEFDLEKVEKFVNNCYLEGEYIYINLDYNRAVVYFDEPKFLDEHGENM